jgi:hypothetical protein
MDIVSALSVLVALWSFFELLDSPNNWTFKATLLASLGLYILILILQHGGII